MRLDPDILNTADIKDILKYAINHHDGYTESRLQDYYEGKHDILNRKMTDATKPNNKLVNNLPSYITDTVVGYFMGKPVAYRSEDDAFIEDLADIFGANNEQDHNSELAKSQSVKGKAYELLYMDDEPAIKFVELPAENVMYIVSADIEEEPVMAVRAYKVDNLDGSSEDFYDVYTDSEVVVFKMKKEGDTRTLTEVERWEHYFGEVPVIEYRNNAEKMGDFEGVIDLIDAYNKSQSDTANDFEYFTDAYLLTTGAGIEPDQAGLMKERRVINLPDKEARAEWLIKDVNDTATENYKNRLREDIHTFSKVPDLTSDEFGTSLSGVAIAYRMMNLEQMCATKERKFKRGLQRRIKLITNILNMQDKNYDWRDVEIQFTRNLPQNIKELAEIVSDLLGIVDNETLLSLLPFVENPQLVMEKLAEQNEGAVDLDQFGGGEDEPTEES